MALPTVETCADIQAMLLSNPDTPQCEYKFKSPTHAQATEFFASNDMGGFTVKVCSNSRGCLTALIYPRGTRAWLTCLNHRAASRRRRRARSRSRSITPPRPPAVRPRPPPVSVDSKEPVVEQEYKLPELPDLRPDRAAFMEWLSPGADDYENIDIAINEERKLEEKVRKSETVVYHLEAASTQQPSDENLYNAFETKKAEWQKQKYELLLYSEDLDKRIKLRREKGILFTTQSFSLLRAVGGFGRAVGQAAASFFTMGRTKKSKPKQRLESKKDRARQDARWGQQDRQAEAMRRRQVNAYTVPPPDEDERPPPPLEYRRQRSLTQNIEQQRRRRGENLSANRNLFDISFLAENHFNVIISGQPGSGKTTTAKSILYELTQLYGATFPGGVFLISGTGRWPQISKDNYFHNVLGNEDAIASLLNSREAGRKLFIFDDVTMQYRGSEFNLKSHMMKNKHFYNSLMILTHHVKALPSRVVGKNGAYFICELSDNFLENTSIIKELCGGGGEKTKRLLKKLTLKRNGVRGVAAKRSGEELMRYEPRLELPEFQCCPPEQEFYIASQMSQVSIASASSDSNSDDDSDSDSDDDTSGETALKERFRILFGTPPSGFGDAQLPGILPTFSSESVDGSRSPRPRRRGTRRSVKLKKKVVRRSTRKKKRKE